MKPGQRRILQQESSSSSQSEQNRSRSPKKESQSTPKKDQTKSLPFYTFVSFWEDEKVIESEEKHFVNILKSNTWNELHQWALNIKKKYKKKMEIQIPFGLQPQQYQCHLLIIKGIIISRIARFATIKKIQDQKNCLMVIQKYNISLQQLNLSTSEDLKFFLPQLLNASRAFLDNEDSVKRSFEYAHNTVRGTQPNETQIQKIQTFLEDFKQLLQTQLVVSALKKIQGIYSTKLGKLTIKQMQTFLQMMQIDFVQGANYLGMVSFQGIFIHNDLIDIKSKNDEASLLRLLFHEGMHLLLRQGTDNILELTPPNEVNEDKNLEGGFLFESLVFGNHQKKYWLSPEKLLNLNNWNKEPPLFSEQELQNMEINYLPNFKCSGIYPIPLQLKAL